MFKKGCAYSHSRMLDAAILVLGSQRNTDGSYKLKIRWVNRRGLDLGLNEDVTIVKEEVKNWYEI